MSKQPRKRRRYKHPSRKIHRVVIDTHEWVDYNSRTEEISVKAEDDWDAMDESPSGVSYIIRRFTYNRKLVPLVGHRVMRVYAGNRRLPRKVRLMNDGTWQYWTNEHDVPGCVSRLAREYRMPKWMILQLEVLKQQATYQHIPEKRVRQDLVEEIQQYHAMEEVPENATIAELAEIASQLKGVR